jgi:hypothetical protein
MSGIDLSFNSEIFRKDNPLVLATNRASAVLLPVRLRYDSDGYVAGQTLGRNTSDGWFQKYESGGSSGIDTAACILLKSAATGDFDGTGSTGSTTAVGIFGGCAVYKDNLIDWDSDAKTDLNGREITDASGTTLVYF